MEHNNRMMTALAFMAVVAVSMITFADASDATEKATDDGTVEYRYYDEESGEWKNSSKECTELSNGTDNWTASGEEGWYFASGDVTISKRIEITGDVHLVLKDDCVLNLPKGVHLPKDSSLTIYSGNEGTGKIHSESTGAGFAGIGGNADSPEKRFVAEDSGNLTIHGGIVESYGYANIDGFSTGGAGIGGGGATNEQFTSDASGGDSGNVTIYGGEVLAVGGFGSAGIGGGFGYTESGKCGDIRILGGNVTAIGGYKMVNESNSPRVPGAGIGYGGCLESSIDTMEQQGSVSILGGTVIAVGGLDVKTEPSSLSPGEPPVVTKKPDIPGMDDQYYEYGVGPGIGSYKEGIVDFSLTNNGVLITNNVDNNSSPDDSDLGGLSFINPKLRYYITDPDGNYFNQGDRDVDGDGITTVDVTGRVHGTSVTLTVDLHIPDGYTLEIDSGKTLIIQNGVTLTNDHKIVSNGILQNEGTISGNAITSDKGIWLNNTESQTIGGEVSGNYLHCNPVINIHFRNSEGKDVTEITSEEQINVIVTVTSGAGNILMDENNIPEVTLSLVNEKANTSLVQGKYVCTFTISAESNLLVVGENTITASISQTGHFLSGGSASATLTVTENEEEGEIEYEPSADVSVTFNGEAHTISPPLYDADAEFNITYSTSTGTEAPDDGTYTLTAPPSFTDAGTYTVWYRITSDGLTPVIDSATVTISPAQITGTLVVEGDLGVDERLTANLTSTIQTGFVYQWYIGGVPIDGATGTSYTPTRSDIGKTVMVTASADDGNYCGYLWAFAQGSNGSSADGDVPSQDGQPSVQPPAVPDYPVFVPDDDYVPLPPNIVIEEDDNGNDDTENILAVVVAAVFAALVGVYLWGDRRRQ